MVRKLFLVLLCLSFISTLTFADNPFAENSKVTEDATDSEDLETADVVVEKKDESEKSDTESEFPITGTIAANNLRVRQWPWGPVMGKYNEGTKVTVLGVSGEFYEVMVNGIKGYMHRNYISIPGTEASLETPDYPENTKKGGYLSKEQGVKRSDGIASGEIDPKNSGNKDSGNNDSGKKTTTPGEAIITADSRVLHIGDSHCMGIYGKTIDGLMRDTGATVRTEAFGGANPQWFMNGQLGVCGSYSKDENGNEVTTGANQAYTPKLKDMLGSYKPNVLVVSLGANMLSCSESTQRSMVTGLLDQAKAAGCQIVWVGPPDSSKLSDSDNDRFYKVLESELPKYNGVLIDSRKYTKYPPGGDGIHYWGDEGVKQAKNWANEAMNVMTGK